VPGQNRRAAGSGVKKKTLVTGRKEQGRSRRAFNQAVADNLSFTIDPVVCYTGAPND